jgi:ABC-type multidrug transport system fused ATPase/permease subunit
MSQDYYIVTHKGDAGPYDIVMLVKKIRNGTLTPTTMLRNTDEGSAKQAQDWTVLNDFFQEIVEDTSDIQTVTHAKQQSLNAMLKGGWHFLQQNQLSTLFSGLVVLTTIILLVISVYILPPSVRVLAYVVCFILGHFFVSCYLLVVLRMSRGQPVDSSYVQDKIGGAALQLLISSLLVSFVAVVGLALMTSSAVLPITLFGMFIFTGPGLFIIGLYSFAPLLILDQKYDFWEAMETSRKAVLKSGLETAGVLYALYVINFIAGLFVLLPMAITLPITLSAISETYDETFS